MSRGPLYCRARLLIVMEGLLICLSKKSMSFSVLQMMQ